MATPTSGQQAAKQNGTAKSGRRRKVASQAGVNRYHKPIGSEIGGPRDANHAAIQQDQGARKNYGDLIGGDQAAQRKTLDGMSTEDLNKLADISFSFKSSDPKVVALRIAARNAQVRRGIRVKPGQTQTNPGKPAPSVNRSNRGAVKAMSNMPNSARLIELANAAREKDQHATREGSFPIPDVAHLRKAIQAIGRAKPQQRPMVARHIIARAKALNASHLISDHIAHYAKGGKQPGTIGMSRSGSGAIELAGRWKHGYIPLDAVALESKMKGRSGGKRWWGDGTHGGVSGNLKPHGSPKSGSAGKALAPRTSAASPAAKGPTAKSPDGRTRKVSRGELLASLTADERRRAKAAHDRGDHAEGARIQREARANREEMLKKDKTGASIMAIRQEREGDRQQTATEYLDRKRTEAKTEGKSTWQIRDLPTDQFEEFSALDGGDKVKTIEKRNAYVEARKAGKSHQAALAEANGAGNVHLTKRSEAAFGTAPRKRGDTAKPKSVAEQLAARRPANAPKVAQARPAGTGAKLTNVVKSGSADSKPRGAAVNEPHPLTRSRKPISQMSQMSPAERKAEANRADTMSQRQPDRSAEWDSLAKQLRAGSASSKKVSRTPSPSSVSSALNKAGFRKQGASRGGTNHRGQLVQSAGMAQGFKVQSGLRADEVEVQFTGSPSDRAAMVQSLEKRGFAVEVKASPGSKLATLVVTRGDSGKA